MATKTKPEAVKTQTLALELRPKRWDEVIGQEMPVTILRNSLAVQDVKPGYLFVGASGCGKTSAALLLGCRLLCEQPDTASQDPCGTCKQCELVQKGIHPDLKYVDGAADRSVGFVRETLKPFLGASPIGGKHKIIIIDEAHLYSTDAISAFLTLLEAMPRTAPKSLVVFCTTEEEKLPETIVNRCLKLTFAPIDPDSLAQVMAKHTGCDVEALRFLAEECGGSFRTMWSHIEGWQYTQQELTEDLVMKLIGGVPARERALMWQDVSQGRSDKVVDRWQAWLKRGAFPHVVGRHLLKDLIRRAAANPGRNDWVPFLALASNAQLNSPESAWLPTLLRLCGLSLDSQDGARPGPEERQPVISGYDPERDQVAQRLLLFGA